MTLLDFDLDTIQHLDFDPDESDPCVYPGCSDEADFSVTHRKSCGYDIHWCGKHTTERSNAFKGKLYVYCVKCYAVFDASEIIYTPLK